MTSLSRQLANLAAPQTSIYAEERKLASLLFEPSQIAQLDRAAVHAIGQEGVDELCGLDKSFAEYKDSLLSDASMDVQRAVLSSKENRQLDTTINRFLITLIPFALHKAAHKALEWLVYRYQIHEYNWEMLLRTFLPVHDTNIFVKILQAVNLKESNIEWAWLIPAKQAAVPVPRNIIIKQVTRHANTINVLFGTIDQVLKLFADADPSDLERRVRLLCTLVASVCIETMQSDVTDHMVANLIPHIALALNSSVPSVSACGSMILCQLCSVVSLTEDAVEPLTRILLSSLRRESPDEPRTTLMTLLVVCQTQTPDSLPKSSVEKLAKAAEKLQLIERLRLLSQETDVDTLIVPFILGLCQSSFKGGEAGKRASTYAALADTMSTLMHDTASGFRLVKLMLAIFEGLSLTVRWKFGDLFGPVVLNVCRRLPTVFDRLAKRHSKKKKSRELWSSFISRCNLPEHELGIETQKADILDKEVKTKEQSKTAPIPKKPKVQKDHWEHDEDEGSLAPLDGPLLKTLKEAIKTDDADNVLLAVKHCTEAAFLAYDETKRIKLLDCLLSVLAAEKPLSGEIVDAAMRAMKLLPTDEVMLCGLIAGKRFKNLSAVDTELSDLSPSDWRRVSQMLHVLAVREYRKPHNKLTMLLFHVLQLLLDATEQDKETRSFRVQLVISSLARVVEASDAASDASQFRVDLLVRCMRESYQAKVTGDVLRLLVTATKIYKEKIISHMMDVFLFMGSAGMLGRDDANSVHLLHSVVSTIVRTLHTISKDDGELMERLIAVFDMMGSALPDVPVHRQQPILTALLEQPENHLWVLVAVVLKQLVLQWNRLRVDVNRSQDAVQPEEDVLMRICGEQPVELQLSCADALLQALVTLNNNNKPSNVKSAMELVLDVSTCNSKQLRHYRYMMCGWVLALVKHDALLNKLAVVDDEHLEQGQLCDGLQSVLLCCLRLLDECNKNMAVTGAEQVDVKYWRAVYQRVDHILKRLKQMLPASVGIVVMKRLLDVDDHMVRLNCMDLLNARLVQQPTPFTQKHVAALCQLAQQISQWLSVDEDVTKAEFWDDQNRVALMHAATLTTKLLTRVAAPLDDKEVFDSVLSTCVRTVRKHDKLMPDSLRAAMLLCIGELVVVLKVKALPDLKHIVKLLIKHCGRVGDADDSGIADSTPASSSGLYELSVFTCLHRLIDSMADYLSPYLTDIIMLVTAKSMPSTSLNDAVKPRLAQINKRLAAMPTRLLIPAVDVATQQINSHDQLTACMSLVLDHVSNHRAMVAENLSVMFDIVMRAMHIRCDNNQLELDELSRSELVAVDVLTAMSLHVSENEYRPIIHEVCEWAEQGLQPDQQHGTRLITLYRLADRLASKLRALFLLFSDRFINLIPEVLPACHASKLGKKERLLSSKRGLEEMGELVNLVVDVVEKCSRFGGVKFVTSTRFDSLYKHIVAQIDNVKLPGYAARMNEHVAPCMVSMMAALEDDSLLKSANYALLLHTRDARAEVRLASVHLVAQVYAKLNLRCHILVNEAAPFLAELLEDENEDVERECHQLVATLEQLLGESMQQYF